MSARLLITSVMKPSARACGSGTMRERDGVNECNGEKARRSERQALEEHRLRQHPLARIARRPSHRGIAAFLIFEDERAGRIDDELHECDVQRKEEQRPAEQQRRQTDAGERQVDGQQIRHGGTDVLVDAASGADAATTDPAHRRAARGPTASRATSVPRLPMAMPMWAALSAGASFTPSPIIATISPLSRRARTSRSFCSGVVRAKTEVGHESTQLRVAGGGELGAHRDPEPSRPSRTRHGACRLRVIPGDHDDANAGAAALGERGGHRCADRVAQREQAKQLEVRRHVGLSGRTSPSNCRRDASTRSPSFASSSTFRSIACRGRIRRCCRATARPPARLSWRLAARVAAPSRHTCVTAGNSCTGRTRESGSSAPGPRSADEPYCLAALLDCALHRIEGLELARGLGSGQQAAHGIAERRCLVVTEIHACAAGVEDRNRHAVFGERAGLVHGEHGCGRRAPRSPASGASGRRASTGATHRAP